MKEDLTLGIDAGLAIITIDRPRSRNALDEAAQEKFADVVESLFTLESLRVVIITASGSTTFVSGGDLKELFKNPNQAAGERLNRIMGHALDRLTQLPVPVIGAANGDAIGGGCEILTACDLRISVPNARFRLAEVSMALSTGWGGTARLVRMIGLSRALDLLLTGRTFDAEEALDIGFINRVVPPSDEVLDAACRWAGDLIKLPKHAMAAAKELAWASTELAMDEALTLERSRFTQLWMQSDHLEAMKAFAEKRAPRFNQEVE
jgi:enoyl-CoA hydratase/carnithine racemase